MEAMKWLHNLVAVQATQQDEKGRPKKQVLAIEDIKQNYLSLNIMPSRILEMIKAKVSQLPKEVPKPQKPVKEPKIKKEKKTNIKL